MMGDTPTVMPSRILILHEAFRYLKNKRSFYEAFPEVRKKVIELKRLGYSYVMLARVIGLPRRTIIVWDNGISKVTEAKQCPHQTEVRNAMMLELGQVRAATTIVDYRAYYNPDGMRINERQEPSWIGGIMPTNQKLRELFKLMSHRRSFYAAFPEIKEEVLNIYSLGYSYKGLAKVLGMYDQTLRIWDQQINAVRKTQSSQNLIDLRDVMMHELRAVGVAAVRLGRRVHYDPDRQLRDAVPLVRPEPFNPQEDDLEDEWELDDPF